MRILGIDPGTAIIGYGIIESGHDYKHVAHGCIFTEKDLSQAERLVKVYDGLVKVIKEYRPDHVAVEDLFFSKNVKTAISVGQARGVILLAAAKAGLEVKSYTPTQVKQGVTAYGRSDKKDVQNMTARLLNLGEVPKPDDAADALAIAITHANFLSNNILLQLER